MLKFALLGLLVGINAHFHNYGNSYNNYGFTKLYTHPYHTNFYWPTLDKGIGFQHNYKLPHYNHYQYSINHVIPQKTFHVKPLPPVYKVIKPTYFVKYPVIIRNIPVIHNTKQVTVKHLPPIYKFPIFKPTVFQKDVKHTFGERIPKIPVKSVGIPKTDFKGVYDKYPKDKGVKKDMKDKDVKDDEEQEESDDDYEEESEEKGFDKKDMKSMKKNKESEYDFKDFEEITNVKHSFDRIPKTPVKTVGIPKTDFKDVYDKYPKEKGLKDEKDMKDKDVKDDESDDDYEEESEEKGFDDKDIMSLTKKKNKESEYDLKDFEENTK